MYTLPKVETPRRRLRQSLVDLTPIQSVHRRVARGREFPGRQMDKSLKCRRRKIGTVRFEVNLDVQFSTAKPGGTASEAIGVARNLSMRGALIETHAVVTTDDQLTLHVTLPNHAELLEIRGCAVRWVRGHQLGVEFLQLHSDTSRQLMKYLSGIHNATRVQGESAGDPAKPK
jgi:PilZ domain